jgi:hypothetical protein
LQAPNPNRLPRPAHPPANIPGEGGKMSQKNQNSWNDKWQAQMDMAHAELLEMNELRESLEDLLSQINLNMRIQLAFMELIHSQIKPPE